MADKPLRTIFAQDNLYIIKGSELDRIRKQKYTPNEDDLLAMKRSLLLYHWRTGSAVRDIRRATKLAGFLSGDLSRLADVAAFLLEALSSLADKFDDTQHMVPALRTFAGTVHYGVPGMAVPFANKHVRGISRPMLKKLCDEFSGVGDLAVHLLLERDKFTSIPETPRKKLIDALTRRLPAGDEIGVRYHYIIVSRWIRQNILDESWENIIRDIYSSDSDESLCSAFSEMLAFEQVKYSFFSIENDHVYTEIYDKNVLFLFMHDRAENDIELNAMLARISSISNKKKDKIVVVSSTGFSSPCAVKAHEEGFLLITSDGLVQACFRSIADTRTNIPLSKFILGYVGYANLSDIDEKMKNFISKTEETQKEDLSMDNKEYDVFLSHASIDKEKHARPLADALDSFGITYWLDEKEISWGDSITKKINEGLQKSRFVILLLSENYIERGWTNAEMQSAVNRQNSQGQKVVLPLFIGDRKKLIENYPLITDIQGVNWDDGLDSIIEKLKKVLSPSTKKRR